MSRYSIEAVFKAVDQMSRPLKKMTTQNRRFTRAISRDFARAQRSVDNFGRNLSRNIGRAASRIAAAGFLAIGAGVAIATREFINFDQAITAASAKFGPAFRRGTEGFEKLGKVAREVGATTEFSATQAAEGLDFLALAGFKAEQAMSLLPGIVDLATAAQTDLATSSDIASDALGAFGLMSDNAGELSLNFARIMDVMAKTTTTSNTDLVTLFESVKKGAPTFTAAGQSLESFNALAGIMANNSLKGSDAGTSLRNIMLRLSKPTGEAANVLEKLGVQTADSAGNFRDVIDILGDFEKGLEGMGTQQRTAALATVFGARTVTGINILLAEGTDKLRAYRGELENATGSAGDMAKVMRTSLANQLKTLSSAALELGFKFVEAFEKDGRGAIESITEAIRNFDMKPVIEGIKTAVRIFTTLFKIIKPFLPLILSIVAAWKLYKITMIAAAAIQALMNIAMTANPIGLIITAVGALIGLTIILMKHWEAIWGFFKKVGAALGFGGEGTVAGGGGTGLGIGDALETRGGAEAPISPSERGAFIREERISRGEVTIRDEAGRAEITKSPSGPGFTLALERTGIF